MEQIELQADEKLKNVVNELFETTNPEEINATIALMMDSFIVHAQVDRESIANAVSLSHQLMNFFTEIRSVC